MFDDAGNSDSHSIVLSAYAKINLTLDVFSKRPDGYHGIASVMQTISLRDTLTFTGKSSCGISFTCDGPESEGVPVDNTNLVVRAATAALEAGVASNGVSVHLHKAIPSQAGLGGGSSDAASALIGVNTLLQLNLGTEKLHNLAASIGSDVPFFLLGGSAVARGRGEQLSSSPDIPKLWLVVIKPEENVSTGWAYGELDAEVDRSSHRGTKRMEQAIEQADERLILSRMCNDFELPVLGKFPKLAWLHDELMMAGALKAHLCGSGSALFAVTASEPDAHRIAKLMQPRYPKCYVASTLSREEVNPVGTTLNKD